jgi:ATP-binding cassette, subfamily B, bacterial CvaB/MchF/RaxB
MRDVVELAQRLALRRPEAPLLMQSETAECGLACLAMIARYHGHRIDLPSLRLRFPPSVRGVTLLQLMNQANTLRLAGRALRLEPAQMSKLQTPCILHWDLSHYVVLVSQRGERSVIHDPALGRRTMERAEVSRHFTGVALELVPTSTFEPVVDERPTRIQDLWSRMHGWWTTFLLVLALSTLLQLLALGAPFYSQLVVDQVIAKHDENLLLVLACGFGLLMLLQTAIGTLRDYTVLYASSLLSFQMGANLLSHLVRLPLPYFEARHLGDVISRFGSISAVQSLLTTGLIGALLDGVMALAVLALMFVYSPMLSVIALTAVAFSVALRVGLYRPMRQIQEETIAAQAKESTLVMELLRGIQSVKLLGGESQHEGLWQNRHADSMNARVRSARWSLGFQTVSAILLGIENLFSIYLAAKLVFAGTFSVGMLYAFASYKAQLMSRMGSLTDWLLQYRMLEVHLGRLGDIVHTQEETGLRSAAQQLAVLNGTIEFRGVSFRYGETEPFVFRGVSFRIEAGSCVGIVGRSGGGKTTLLKLVLGLLQPTEGEILVDGRRLAHADVAWYRGQISAVMQDDHFFQGSVAENISGFDPDESPERIREAVARAQIDKEIAAFPMGIHTSVGTMGSSLSGGQRQRILLARAFYRDPRLLVLDEGTAHLDPGIVAGIWDELRKISCTRLIASHQPFPVGSLDQLLVVDSGRVSNQALRGDSVQEEEIPQTPFAPERSTETTHPQRWAEGDGSASVVVVS